MALNALNQMPPPDNISYRVTVQTGIRQIRKLITESVAGFTPIEGLITVSQAIAGEGEYSGDALSTLYVSTNRPVEIDIVVEGNTVTLPVRRIFLYDSPVESFVVRNPAADEPVFVTIVGTL